MEDETFNIYYAGEVLEGHDSAGVRRGLAVLFNANDSTLDKLFSGATHLIRRGLDREQAMRYKAAMERAGARPRVTRTAADEQTGSTAPGLTLAPPGADVLRPEDRRSDSPAAVDVASLSLAPAGDRLGPVAEAPPAPPATDALSLAPAGETLPGLAGEAPPAAPDVSALTLAEGDLSAPAPAQSAELAAPDLDLAEPGADVLEARFRRRDDSEPPATDHLELEP